MDFRERLEDFQKRKISEEAMAKRLALTRMKRSYELKETMVEASYPDKWKHLANNEDLIRVSFRVRILF